MKIERELFRYQKSVEINSPVSFARRIPVSIIYLHFVIIREPYIRFYLAVIKRARRFLLQNGWMYGMKDSQSVELRICEVYLERSLFKFI